MSLNKDKAWYHKFNENTLICEYCNEHIEQIQYWLCSVITPDEVSRFRSNEDYYD